MAEITLGDLLAWEPRLAIAGRPPTVPTSGQNAPPDGARVFEREVTWAAAARGSAPVLPALRGGELVLLPPHALVESGSGLGALLRELVARNAAGVVLEEGAAPPGLLALGPPVPILAFRGGAIQPELEGDLNRLLTERRGELYRVGTDVGRLLTELTTAGADLDRVLAATHEALGIPVVVVDARGRRLAPVDDAGDPAPEAEPGLEPGAEGARHEVGLVGGGTLCLGPVEPRRRALVRLVGERVAVAVEAALAAAARTRPRGPARAAALAALLTAHAERGTDPTPRLAALGLATDGSFRVALAADDVGEPAMHRAVHRLGQVQELAPIDGAIGALVEVRREGGVPTLAPGGRGRMPLADAAGRDVAPTPGGWVALSAPAAAAALPLATRQARYVAALLRARLLRGPVARFDSVTDLGAYRLLFAQWGSPDLTAFAAEGLGDLPARDRRGALRRTLRLYLDTGGSHVEAAAKLGIHRNTLAYRLKQIGALTGYDPADPSTRLLLHLALLAAELPPAPR